MRKVLRKISPPGAVPDIPPVSDAAQIAPVQWDGVSAEPPARKKLVSMRVDADVLAFFQGEGKGYQTRMNAVLRSYMNAPKNSP